MKLGLADRRFVLAAHWADHPKRIAAHYSLILLGGEINPQVKGILSIISPLSIPTRKVLMATSTMLHTIAFFGVGHMGRPMALNLQRAGFAVRVYDIAPAAVQAATEAGLVVAAAPTEAVRGADAIILM